jgi:hypothetical protein
LRLSLARSGRRSSPESRALKRERGEDGGWESVMTCDTSAACFQRSTEKDLLGEKLT